MFWGFLIIDLKKKHQFNWVKAVILGVCDSSTDLFLWFNRPTVC